LPCDWPSTAKHRASIDIVSTTRRRSAPGPAITACASACPLGGQLVVCGMALSMKAFVALRQSRPEATYRRWLGLLHEVTLRACLPNDKKRAVIVPSLDCTLVREEHAAGPATRGPRARQASGWTGTRAWAAARPSRTRTTRRSSTWTAEGGRGRRARKARTRRCMPGSLLSSPGVVLAHEHCAANAGAGQWLRAWHAGKGLRLPCGLCVSANR